MQKEIRSLWNSLPQADRRWFIRVTILSLIFHVFAAFLSTGFHNYDEQYQILEYLASKLGLRNPYDLSWEWHHQMRTWIQPFVYFHMVVVLKALGITSPFNWAIFFRAASSLLGWFSNTLFALSCFKIFRTSRFTWLAILSMQFYWWYPYLQARLSAESLAASVATLALGCWFVGEQAANKKSLASRDWIIGLLWGLAWVLRPQIAFAIAGIFFWLIYTRRSLAWPTILRYSASITLCSIVGVLIDYWGYGMWVFSPFNYFYYNLVTKHINDFGTMPFWGYFQLIFQDSFPPLSILLVMFQVATWFLFPKHVLTWFQVPFLLFHFLLAHKELRFLIPVSMITPAFMWLAVEEWWLNKKGAQKWAIWFEKKSVRMVIYFLLSLNIIIYLVGAFKPIRVDIPMFEYLYNNIDPDKEVNLYSTSANPYGELPLLMTYYQPQFLHFTQVQRVKDFEALLEHLDPGQNGIWFFYEKLPNSTLSDDFAKIEQSCKRAYSTIPDWLKNFNFNNWMSRVKNGTLYQCKSNRVVVPKE